MFGGRRRTVAPCSGIVVRAAGAAEAAALEREIRAGEAAALVEVAVVRVRGAEAGPGELRRIWAQTLRTAARSGGGSAAAALGEAIDEATTGTGADVARVLLHLAGLHFGGDPFVLVVVDPVGDRLPRREIRRLGSALGASWRLVDRMTDVRPDGMVRPPFVDPRTDVPADLSTILCGPDDRVPGAVDRWLTPDAVDSLRGFSIVGPIVAERLRRLGVATPIGARLDGMRRRVWYRNALMTEVAVRAVGELRADGIEPTVLGDLAAAVEAERTGSVRSLGDLYLRVAPDDLERAAMRSADAFGVTVEAPRSVRASVRNDRRVLRLGDGRVLQLTSRWLTGTADGRVPFTPDLTAPVTVQGTTLAVLTPTARVLDLWVRTVDRNRHDRVAATAGLLDLLSGRADEIDRAWLDQACARLELPPPPPH